MSTTEETSTWDSDDSSSEVTSTESGSDSSASVDSVVVDPQTIRFNDTQFNYKGKRVTVQWKGDHIFFVHNGTGHRLAFDDMLRPEPMMTAEGTNAMMLHHFPKNSRGRRTHKKYLIEPVKENMLHELERLHEYIDSVVTQSRVGVTPHPRRLLVLINPMSGRKKAPKRWKKVEPIVRLGNVDLTVLTTTHAQHATELIQAESKKYGSLDRFDGIVTCSGDGLLFEVMQGLNMVGELDKPLGIIPCGTGNSVATSINGLNLTNAAFHVARGFTRALDMERIKLGRKIDLISCGIILSWGITSNSVKRAEGCRWMGGPRYKVAGVREMMANQKHAVTIEYIPSDDYGDLDVCPKNDKCARCDASTMLPPSSDPDFHPRFKKKQWKKVEGQPWENVMVCGLTHIAYDLHASPYAHHNDGSLDLQLQKPLGFFKNVSMLTALQKGQHLNDTVLYEKVQAVKITPLEVLPWNVDGELYELPLGDSVYVYVLPGAGNIMFAR